MGRERAVQKSKTVRGHRGRNRKPDQLTALRAMSRHWGVVDETGAIHGVTVMQCETSTPHEFCWSDNFHTYHYEPVRVTRVAARAARG